MQNIFLFWLFLAWIAYFLIHSVLASLSFKGFWVGHFPRFARFYRLVYNILAIVLLLPIAWLLYSHSWEAVWTWPEPWNYIVNTLFIFAVIGFIFTFRLYSGLDFIGIRQISSRQSESTDEQLRLSRFHQYVRHPWYFLALIMIWSRDMHSGMLLSAIMLTLYLIVGSRIEEKKLIVQFGAAYESYCRQVAGLIPLPWKKISRNEAVKIERAAQQHLSTRS